MNKECPVVFVPETHTYILKETGEIFISGTSFIHLFYNKFDPTGQITSNYAKKYGRSVEDVKEEWRINNKKSTDYGTAVHNSLEHYIRTKNVLENKYSEIVENFKKIKFRGNLVPEKIVFNEKLLICGTADLFDVYRNEKGELCASIYDFKTNKKLEKYSYFRNKMIHCCSHLDDVNFNHYTLQLSLYAYLTELHGVKIENLTILYINPKTYEIEIHPVKYERELIKIMIDYYLNYLKK